MPNRQVDAILALASKLKNGHSRQPAERSHDSAHEGEIQRGAAPRQ